MARGEVARMFVAIGADVREAVRAIQSVRGDLGALQRDARRSADAWDGFTGRLARTGLAIQGIREIARSVRDLGMGIGRLALEASDDRVSMEQLMSSIANTGRAVDDGLRRRLEDTLDTMEATTLFTDRDLRQALQVLVISTGDVDEALARLPLSADLAAREEIQLAQASRMLGRINDDSLTALRKYGIGLEDAAEGSGELAAAQLLAQRAGISVQGALKAVGNESIRKRWGIPDPKDVKGAINEAALLAQAREKLAGGAAGAATGLRGEADQVAKGWRKVQEQIGEFILPVANRALRFFSKGLTGLRRLIQLFSTDVAGPRIGGARKLWQQIFGTEMPKALQAVVGGFEDVRKRIEEFVTDLNSTDDETVRGAVKSLFTGLKDDITRAISEFGSELDKEGLPGIAIKLAIASIAIDKATGGLLGPGDILGFVKDALQIAWLTVALGGGGLLLTAGAGLLIAASALTFANVVQSGVSSKDIFDKLLAPLVAGVMGVSIAFAAGASAPLILTVGAVVVLAFGALTFSTEIGDIIGGWWQEFQAGWEKARADFISWWNTTSPAWMPKIEGPKTGLGQGPKTPGTEFKGATPGETGQTSPVATVADIYAALTEKLGRMPDFASEVDPIKRLGLTYLQLQQYLGTRYAQGGGAKAYAMGGSGVVTKPTLFMAGDRGAEEYKFTPVGAGASAGGGITFAAGAIQIGRVDSPERARQVGDAVAIRTARLLGYSH